MEYPDHLKTPVRERGPGPADLGDVLADELLWDAANWDPDVPPPVPAIPGREPADTAGRLRNGGPEPVYRALGRLARLGALPSTRWPRAWPTAAWPTAAWPGSGPPGSGPPGSGRPGDPWPPGSPAAGPAADLAVGMHEAGKTPGVRLICITGPAGVGKTRLAMDIVTGTQQKLLAAGVPAGRAVPLLTVRLRSVESGAGRRRLIMAAHDALLDLLLALGVAERDVPDSLMARRARYVAELSGRRPVILIDDVVAENQVKLLLPAEAGVVVVTSREGVHWSEITGVVNVPVAPLDARGTGTLVRDIFRACGAEPDDATATAVHDWCRGTPRPVILVSRWLAATAQPAASLAAARRDWDRVHGELAVDGVRHGFPAVAAMLGLLGEDQQVIVRMFGMLRLPEADLAAVCAATGLSRDRAIAALGELTEHRPAGGGGPGRGLGDGPGGRGLRRGLGLGGRSGSAGHVSAAARSAARALPAPDARPARRADRAGPGRPGRGQGVGGGRGAGRAGGRRHRAGCGGGDPAARAGPRARVWLPGRGERAGRAGGWRAGGRAVHRPGAGRGPGGRCGRAGGQCAGAARPGRRRASRRDGGPAGPCCRARAGIRRRPGQTA